MGLKRFENNPNNEYIINEEGDLQSRVVAEKYIFNKNREKYLKPFGFYKVHHINGDTFNNSIQNLYICTKKEHNTIHGEQIRRKKKFKNSKEIEEFLKHRRDKEQQTLEPKREKKKVLHTDLKEINEIRERKKAREKEERETFAHKCFIERRKREKRKKRFLTIIIIIFIIAVAILFFMLQDVLKKEDVADLSQEESTTTATDLSQEHSKTTSTYGELCKAGCSPQEYLSYGFIKERTILSCSCTSSKTSNLNPWYDLEKKEWIRKRS